MKRILLFSVLFLATGSAGAISRTGGGKLESANLGFVADVPSAYTRPNPMTNEGLRLWSNFVMGGSIGVTAESFVELRTLAVEFPDLVKTGRLQTKNLFAALSWAHGIHANTCVDVYQRDSATVTAVSIVWGPGRGVVILGGVSPTAKSAISEIVATLRLIPGGCAW